MALVRWERSWGQGACVDLAEDADEPMFVNGHLRV